MPCPPIHRPGSSYGSVVAVTGVATRPETVTAGDRRKPVWRRLIRGVGWLLIAAGLVILLYLFYVLVWTNRTTARAQDEMLDQWNVEYGPVEQALPAEPAGAEPAPAEPVAVGDAYAVMWFERPGSDERPVHADPLFVVEGIDPEPLKRGPGHYPGTAAPGQPGNFSVAGHRTTYGAPFYHLDQLKLGDAVHVVDRQGREWVYDVVDMPVVLPDELWVIGDDPLGTGKPMLSLITCEPRFSAAKRLIVFAELRTAT